MFGEMESGQGKNRNFICSCQKAYLSYAALFTHIKQKHGGKVYVPSITHRLLGKSSVHDPSTSVAGLASHKNLLYSVV